MPKRSAREHRTRDEAPSPAKLAHVVLRTRHFEASRDWYISVLAADVVFETQAMAFLTYDDEHHRLALLNVPDAPAAPPKAAGLDHVAFTYGDLGDLLATYARLKDAGIVPYWCVNHGPTTSMYYRDPDGTQVELQIDNFESTDALNAWFRSGAFAENPIGVEFDPDDLIARYRAGTPQEELVRRP